MTFKELYHSFDADAYARQIANEKWYPRERLEQKASYYYRNGTGAIFTTATGLAGAPFTFGGTLVASAYGARKTWVGVSKYGLIQAELKRRDHPEYKRTMADALIPTCAAVAGLAAGAGVQEVAFLTADTFSTAVVTSTAPGADAAHGLGSGISAHYTGLGHGIAETWNPNLPVSDAGGIIQNSAAGNAGFNTGTAMATGGDKFVAALAASEYTRWHLTEADKL